MTTEIKKLKARIRECSRDIAGMERSAGKRSIRTYVQMIEYREGLYRELSDLYRNL